MTEKHAAESNKAEAGSSANHGKDTKFLQAFTLIALFLFWIGYVFALYKGNDSKMSGYSLLIVAFSLVNFNALCGITKIENKALNILARLDGVLFFAWAAITVVSLLLK